MGGDKACHLLLPLGVNLSVNLLCLSTLVLSSRGNPNISTIDIMSVRALSQSCLVCSSGAETILPPSLLGTLYCVSIHSDRWGKQMLTRSGSISSVSSARCQKMPLSLHLQFLARLKDLETRSHSYSTTPSITSSAISSSDRPNRSWKT